MQIVIRGLNGQKAALSPDQLNAVEDLLLDVANRRLPAAEADRLIAQRLDERGMALNFGATPTALDPAPDLQAGLFNSPPEL